MSPLEGVSRPHQQAPQPVAHPPARSPGIRPSALLPLCWLAWCKPMTGNCVRDERADERTNGASARWTSTPRAEGSATLGPADFMRTGTERRLARQPSIALAPQRNAGFNAGNSSAHLIHGGLFFLKQREK